MMKYSALMILFLNGLAYGANHETAEAGHDHAGHDHDDEEEGNYATADHAEDEISTTIDVYDADGYHMQLEYFVEPDEFGDNWLTFESTLEIDAATLVNGNLISQWYQLLDDHHGHDHDSDGDDHGDHDGHDHRMLLLDDSEETEEDPWYETVQATITIDTSAEPVPVANQNLSQHCGHKLQETFVDTAYTARNEDTGEVTEPCTPWLAVADGWSNDAGEAEAAFKRKLVEKQLSEIDLKAGTYKVRAGFFVQTSASVLTGQISKFNGDLEITIADSAMQGLAAGIMALSATLIF